MESMKINLKRKMEQFLDFQENINGQSFMLSNFL